jgi:hypothetical protein
VPRIKYLEKRTYASAVVESVAKDGQVLSSNEVAWFLQLKSLTLAPLCRLVVQGVQTVTLIELFCWGFLGSAAVEVLLLHGYYKKGPELPKRYRSRGFWLTRILLAILAGGLAIAYAAQTPILAFHLGAATPLIVQGLAQNTRQIL